MTLVLRDYQKDLVARVNARFKSGARSVCMQAGTGSGKTAMMADLLRRASTRGYRSLFLAHLDALLDDTAERLAAAGIDAGMVQAGRAASPTALVQIASLQTLHVRGERPPADFIILDECHRAESASVQGILQHYPAARLLGGTATAQRGDGKPLGNTFQVLEQGPSNRWLTANGFLVPCDLLAPESYVDDLNEDPLQSYLLRTPNTRAIVFASNVLHAHDLTRRFNEAGVSASTILGDTPREERRAAKARVASGEQLVLVGVGVFVEGFDLGAIETVVLARGFGVPGPFLQAIGRGLRPSHATGKTKCTVLDLRGAVNLHGLPDEDRVWSLTGRAVRRTETMTAIARCDVCWAMYRPAVRCPRCGAEKETQTKVPRVLSRAEKMERWSGVPQSIRDARYVATLERVARERLRMPAYRATKWAMEKFEQKFGRRPGGGQAA